MRRVLSGSSSQRGSDPDDIALEAYKELDFREAEFFLFLDKELMKVEKFHRNKENEAKERLEVIREHLHIMRNYRLAEIMAKERRRNEEPGSPNNQQINGDAASDQEPAGETHRRDFLPRPVSKSIDFASQAFDKVRSGPVGKTSKAMGTLGTPEFRGTPWLPEPSQRDYSRRAPHDVPYRVAKRKMKMALAEYYRGLELLKSYALLNRTAFRKINKKYDKTVNAKPPLQYMDQKVTKSCFVTSDEADRLMATAEDLYARYFEKGNRKVAVSKLRTKTAGAGDYTGPVARTCALLGAGLVLGIEGVVKGTLILFNGEPRKQLYTAYLLQLYAGYFMMVLLALLFCGCAGIFHEFRVNYQFIFELDNRQSANWLQMTEIPAWFFFLMSVSLWVNFDMQPSNDTMYLYWIVIMIGLAVISFFAPAPLFYHRARKWFGYTLWRLLFAGIYSVEFRDFFIGDMFCSLTYSLGNAELFFCLYAGNWNNPAVCNSSNSHLLGFLATLPGIWRAAQCIRRYLDSRSVFPHLVNCGKYFFTVMQYMTLSLYRTNQTAHTKAAFIAMATINGTYCSIWDLFMDWSLGDPKARRKFLRPTLAYRKHVWVYYVAMVLDPILRFNWIFYAIYTSDTRHSPLVSFLVSISEVLRRGMWTLFRVENEHCTNVENAKASRDIPLPYRIGEEASTEELIPPPPGADTKESEPLTADLDPTDIPGPIAPVQETSYHAGANSGPAIGDDNISVMKRDKKKEHANGDTAKSHQDGHQNGHQNGHSKKETFAEQAANAGDASKPWTFKPGRGIVQRSSQSTKGASGVDVDLERQPSENSTLRQRRGAGGSEERQGSDSPMLNTLHRVGTVMRAAHRLDYVKKKPNKVEGQGQDSEDDDDDDDDDDDSDAV
jgi:hypothetical protein